MVTKDIRGKRAQTSGDPRSDDALRYRKLYKTARWQAIRRDQLQRHPLCEACAKRNRITPATVCNHLDKDSKATDFFRGPFSSSCAPCHDAGEQKAESAGFSGEADADGWPISPLHPSNRPR